MKYAEPEKLDDATLARAIDETREAVSEGKAVLRSQHPALVSDNTATLVANAQAELASLEREQRRRAGIAD